jgi:hypothetical protein
MKSRHTPHSPLNHLLGLGIAASLVSGCAQTDPSATDTPGNPPNTPDASPITSTDPYAGPPVSIKSGSATHTVVISAPTGGWSVVWDRKLEPQGQIYLTLRQPDPAFFQIQQIVDHQIDSTMPSTGPLEVFVRMVGHNDHTNTVPYASAARADN